MRRSTGNAGSVGRGYRLLSTCFHAGGLLDMAVGSLQPFLVSLGTDMELRHSPQRTPLAVPHITFPLRGGPFRGGFITRYDPYSEDDSCKVLDTPQNRLDSKVSWRNGSARDGSPRGCLFNSSRGHSRARLLAFNFFPPVRWGGELCVCLPPSARSREGAGVCGVLWVVWVRDSRIVRLIVC